MPRKKKSKIIITDDDEQKPVEQKEDIPNNDLQVRIYQSTYLKKDGSTSTYNKKYYVKGKNETTKTKLRRKIQGLDLKKCEKLLGLADKL